MGPVYSVWLDGPAGWVKTRDINADEANRLMDAADIVKPYSPIDRTEYFVLWVDDSVYMLVEVSHAS